MVKSELNIRLKGNAESIKRFMEKLEYLKLEIKNQTKNKDNKHNSKKVKFNINGKIQYQCIDIIMNILNREVLE